VLAKRVEAEAKAEANAGAVAKSVMPARPVSASRSAKRNQPSRSTRAKRNKG
jgi:hypothetical protein